MPISEIKVFFIITSATEPDSKFPGLRWDEVDFSGNLIQSWIWLNNGWTSPNKNIFISITATTGYFPLITDYRYLFKSINIWLRPNATLTSSSYARITTQTLKGSVATPVDIQTFNNQAANTSLIKSQLLNQLYTPTANESIRFLLEKINSSAALDTGIELNYQLVRK